MLSAATRTIRTILDADASPLVRGYQRAEQAVRSTADAVDRGGQRMRQSTADMGRSAAQGEGALVRMGRAAEQNSREFTQAGTALAAAGAILTGTAVASAKAAIDWESAWIGVRKVMSGTPEEIAAVEGELRELARTLPSSHQEIAAVAETAARLGVGTKDISAFTRTMIDMGETTTLSAEEAANGIARFSNVMGTATEDASRVGSAVVELGNNFATTETEILNMAQRLAAAARVAGFTESDVLGLSAAMSEVGINAEAGGTAMSRVMMKISAAVDEGGSSVQGFADLAGMTADEFSTRWREAPVEALMAVVGGLGQMSDSGEGAFAVLEELGLQDIRVANTMLSLAGNAEGAARAVESSSRAWEENVALTKEAEQRYASVESQIKMAWASIQDAAITAGQVFLPIVVEVADTAAMAANAVAGLPPELAGVISIGGATAGALGLVAGGFLLVTPRAVETYRAFQQLGIIGPRTSGAIRGVANVLTGPWGVAIAAGVIAVGLFMREQAKAKQEIEEVRTTLDEQTGALTENTRSWAVKSLQDGKGLALADELGISHKLVADAVMDEGNARSELSAILDENIKASMRSSDVWGAADSEAVQRAQTTRELNDVYLGLIGTVDKALDKEAEYLALMAESESALDRVTPMFGTLASEVASAAAEHAAAAPQVDRWTTSLDRAKANGEDAVKAYQDMKTQIAEASGAFVDGSAALATVNEATQEWAQQQADATESADDSWEDFWDGQTVSLDKWLDELERMQEAQAAWEENMVLLAGRASSGVVEQFESMGVEGAALLADAVEDPAALARLEKAFGTHAQAGVDGYATGMLDASPILRAAASRWGQEISDEIAAKLASGEMTAAEAVAAYDLAATIEVVGDLNAYDAQVAQALEYVNNSFATSDIEGDATGHGATLGVALGAVEDSSAVSEILGDHDRYLRTLDDALRRTGNAEATSDILGRNTPFMGSLSLALGAANRAYAEARVGANTNPLYGDVGGALGWIGRQWATVNVQARLRGSIIGLGSAIVAASGNYAGAMVQRASGGYDEKGRYHDRQSGFYGPQYDKTSVVWPSLDGRSLTEFGERSTDWELYLSGHPAFRDKNIGLLAQGASKYGYRIEKLEQGAMRQSTPARTYAPGWHGVHATPQAPSSPVAATPSGVDEASLTRAVVRGITGLRLEVDGRELGRITGASSSGRTTVGSR